jgi:hypothetical protein
MEDKVKDGGPAFPCSNEQYTHGNSQSGDAWSGLSLRDWFAGQALAGLCHPGWEADPVEAAPVAYRIADAMLAAREPTQ